MIAYIKPSKIQIYVNSGRKTMAQVKAELGCTHIINGGFYDMTTFKAVCVLIADGIIHAYEWNGEGYCFDTLPPTFKWSSKSDKNFVYGVPLVVDGKARVPIGYASAWGGARPRTAMGVLPDGRIWLYCDQSNKTPEQLQQIALDAGVESAIMLDGGGSTQGIFPNGTVYSSRIVHNFICLWAEQDSKGGKEEPTMKKKVCLDAGHGGNEVTNASPDKSYYEHEFTLDMAKRVKALLEPYVDVVMTRESNTTVSLAQRAAIANSAKADVFVSLHSNASGSTWSNASGLCVYTYGAGATLPRNILANKLLEQFSKAGIKLFGSQLYHSKFTVLANTVMPAVVIEYGFHTNTSDVANLKSDTWRQTAAEATARGICDFLGITYKETQDKPTDAQAAFNKLVAAGWDDVIIKMAEKI